MADAYFYSNVAIASTIGNPGGISNSSTSLYLASGPSGYPASFPFKLSIENGTGNEEVVKVTSGSGTVGTPWVIVRGWDGTTAVSHAAGAAVIHAATAEDWRLSRDHEVMGSGSGVHGLPLSAWSSSAFAVITETTLVAPSATITFGSIPGSYAHLVLVLFGRTSPVSGQGAVIQATVNGDTGSLYSYSLLTLHDTGGGITDDDTSAWAQSSWQFMTIPTSTVGGAATVGGGWALFPGYAGTQFNKQFISHSGWGLGTSRNLNGPAMRSGLYNPASQAAITTIALAAPSGNFLTGTFAGLYGF